MRRQISGHMGLGDLSGGLLQTPEPGRFLFGELNCKSFCLMFLRKSSCYLDCVLTLISVGTCKVGKAYSLVDQSSLGA